MYSKFWKFRIHLSIFYFCDLSTFKKKYYQHLGQNLENCCNLLEILKLWIYFYLSFFDFCDPLTYFFQMFDLCKRMVQNFENWNGLGFWIYMSMSFVDFWPTFCNFSFNFFWIAFFTFVTSCPYLNLTLLNFLTFWPTFGSNIFEIFGCIWVFFTFVAFIRPFWFFLPFDLHLCQIRKIVEISSNFGYI